MPIITRLVQGKKNPNRVNLYLDEEFAFALSIDEVAKHSLKKGLDLSVHQIEELKQNDQSEYVYAKIFNFLSYRPRSVKEVRDRLQKYDVKEVEKQDFLIAKLKDRGYLDDTKFAKWFIESRAQNRPRSPRMLASELISKGISQDVITSLKSSMASESDSIIKILRKKLGDPGVIEQDVRQKIYSHLGRHGSSWEKIKEVVKSWESE